MDQLNSRAHKLRETYRAIESITLLLPAISCFSAVDNIRTTFRGSGEASSSAEEVPPEGDATSCTSLAPFGDSRRVERRTLLRAGVITGAAAAVPQALGGASAKEQSATGVLSLLSPSPRGVHGAFCSRARAFSCTLHSA